MADDNSDLPRRARRSFPRSSRRTARSSPTGFLIFMLCIGGISFVSGVVFLLLGAWPVFGFFGLDVLLVYWAFRANYRAGARL